MCLIPDIEATGKFLADWKDGEKKTFLKVVRCYPEAYLSPYMGLEINLGENYSSRIDNTLSHLEIELKEVTRGAHLFLSVDSIIEGGAIALLQNNCAQLIHCSYECYIVEVEVDKKDFVALGRFDYKGGEPNSAVVTKYTIPTFDNKVPFEGVQDKIIARLNELKKSVKEE